MKEFKCVSIKKGGYFSKPAYLDNGFVLLSQEMPYTSELDALLREWRFSGILSDGRLEDTYSGKVFEKKSARPPHNDAHKIAKAEEYIVELENMTSRLFEQAVDNRQMRYETIAAAIRELCERMKTEKNYFIQAESRQSADELFHAAHCVRSTIIAIVIGMSLKLPAHRLIELGVAALIHEIGMSRLPPHICLSEGKLSPQELETLRTHSLLGYEILKNAGFPMAVCEAAYQHHERENGYGYPLRLTGENISLYSKIIAVSCSYTAITTDRPHQDARDGYAGVTDLLRNTGKQYDEAVVRALVFALSVYPIGQFVMLSNGKKGQVIDINPKTPRFPIVQIFSEQTPDGRNRIIETSPNGIHIQGPVDKDEV
jgi:HD-GYP domain-containing protein (c-di-GMP phosphodiesterase class II)